MSRSAGPAGSSAPAGAQARPLHRSPRALGLVAIGGVVGAALRELLAQALPTATGGFPAATLAANLSGAFVLGALLEVLVRSGDDQGWRRSARLAGGTGVIGAYTTYSTFAVETDQLIRHHHPLTAVVYVVVTVVGGLLAAAAGIAFAAGRARGRGAGSRLPVDPDIDAAETSR